jgi:RNA polymerase sigma factor (sigma-70 family)
VSTSRDAELAAAALRGDREAFAELVTRHWDTAVALATRVLGSADCGADAAQEAAVMAMLGLDRLRSPDRFGAWFCGIALNVARRWARRPRAWPASALAEPSAPEPGPAERAELAELAAAVRSAVASLADGQRQAVHLFYLQGLTHREVAAELGISAGAVKARLHQARAALAPALAPLTDTRLKIPEETTMTPAASTPAWTEVTVSEVRCLDDESLSQRKHVMVLAERDGSRQLPVWVGGFEALSLALALETREFPRPLTYQLAARLVTAAGSRVSEVRITRLTGGIFYAVVAVEGPAGRQEVDARPSDAVNLALVSGAPVMVESGLLDDPGADGRPEWRQYPVRTADLAAEAARLR